MTIISKIISFFTGTIVEVKHGTTPIKQEVRDKYYNRVPHDMSKNIPIKVLGYVKEKYPELVELIVKTESMDNKEKNYWLSNLLAMTDEQVDRLFGILETERRKLEELEAEYQKEIKTINEKHLIEWQSINILDK